MSAQAVIIVAKPASANGTSIAISLSLPKHVCGFGVLGHIEPEMFFVNRDA